MGTTLALTGAYNLAGALLQHPGNVDTAFAQYQAAMLPIVQNAQKLVPGIPHILHPETAWGIQVMNLLIYLIDQSGIVKLLFKLMAGAPERAVPLEDFGFRQLPQMTREDTTV